MDQEQKTITTIYVTPTGLQHIKHLAERFGYYQTRGAGAREIGSVSQLIEAIGREELTLHKHMDGLVKN